MLGLPVVSFADVDYKKLNKGYKYRLTVTNSMKHTFYDCPKKFYYEYVRRLSPKESAIYFAWGHAVHTGLELRTHNLDIGPAVQELQNPANNVSLTDKYRRELQDSANLLPFVLDAYLLKYGIADDRYEVLGTELPIQLDIETELLKELYPEVRIVFEGKIDKIVRDLLNNEILLWEQKTAAQTGPSFWRQLPFDGQTKGYIMGARECHGFDTYGSVYDVIKKTPQMTRKPNSRETSEQFAERTGAQYLLKRDELFERERIIYTPEQIVAYKHEVAMAAVNILFHIDNAMFEMHHPKNRKGGCAYEGLCLDGDGSRTESYFQVRTPGQVNPELVAKKDIEELYA